jgi:predicted DNA-binding transcriptional regulator AlpA
MELIMKTFLTIREFLERYPMGRTSFYRLHNSGALPIVKFGRATRIAESDAIDWANSLPKHSGQASPANDNGYQDTKDSQRKCPQGRANDQEGSKRGPGSLYSRGDNNIV